ncbi:MAG: outer membrane beta-barrel protein [Flavobacteriaceae bacterium]
MMRYRLFTFFLLLWSVAFSQGYQISAKVVDETDAPISYATVLVKEDGSGSILMGAITDDNGSFLVSGVQQGKVSVEISMIGYETQALSIELDKNIHLGIITLRTESETLTEVTVIAKKPVINKTAGKLVFQVQNTSLSVGNTYNLLSKTPGVLVMGDKITIKNRPTTLYINGRRMYLASNEITAYLKTLDASTIQSVEVITNPSAEFDAESGTVLNIITTSATYPGYKGSLSSTYEQAIFPKYQLGTSHFFKNRWLNLYGSYSYSPRTENKDQHSYIRFFEEDGVSTASVWESDFRRITKSVGHQGNLTMDFQLDPKNKLNVTSSIFITPNKTFDNLQDTEIVNAQNQLDSTFVTKSNLNVDTQNLVFGTEYETQWGKDENTLRLGANYIAYKNDQFQELRSVYSFPSMEQFRVVQFQTNSNQETDIITVNLDISTILANGQLDLGAKYSTIDTQSSLDFFDIGNNETQPNPLLSDDFDYVERIAASYFNFERGFSKWNFKIGLRSEYTKVEGTSNRLGSVNTQEYFKLFPSVTLEHQWDDKNNWGIAYARNIQRPRYQSLNPFRYFLNENNFNEGNPNLVPAIEDKVTLSYAHNNKWFVECYYENVTNSLEILNLQDNAAFTLRQLDTNIPRNFQYSLDIVYAAPLNDWWYTNLVTSSFYMENEFFAVESNQERYSNSTYGFFGQSYNQFTLSKDGTLTSDVTLLYISNLISGSLDYNNIFKFSVSLQKMLWNRRARINCGVEDLFDTNNVTVVSRYLNQDNSYFAMPESRFFYVGFQYNLGNYTLRENKNTIKTVEGDRLQ